MGWGRVIPTTTWYKLAPPKDSNPSYIQISNLSCYDRRCDFIPTTNVLGMGEDPLVESPPRKRQLEQAIIWALKATLCSGTVSPLSTATPKTHLSKYNRPGTPVK